MPKPVSPQPLPSAPAPDAVREALRAVMDPELRASIVELDMVKEVSVSDDGLVTVDVALTTLGCPLRAEIRRAVAAEVATLPGIRDVEVNWVEMTEEEKATVMQRARVNARANAPDTMVPSTARVLAVASGKGGVGKSSVTVNLAAALAGRGLRVGVLDADIWGFSVPRMLGLEGRLSGADGKIHPNRRKVDAGGELEVVSMGFLVDDEASALMWRGLILNRAVEQFLTDVRWGADLDYLLVDMPPGTGDVQMGLARMLPQAEMLVVTTPALAAQRVAARVADMARKSAMPLIGVVENMSELVTPAGERIAVFGRGGGAALAAEIGVPLLAQIPLEPDVAAGGDAGAPVAWSGPGSAAGRAFVDLAAAIATELLPPVEMAGCTARILETALANLEDRDAEGVPG
ncbi:MAG: Mrp/NBP35 family ATP-binding protein [Actinobacteria bacterium]|nr:Mrp/NBP35 family ATP-binding protein [Actinomycetota bacterium]